MTTFVKSATDLIPLADRVVVRPMKREETTKGGIVLPDTAKERPQMGEVIAVGPGKYLDNGARMEMEVKAGDKVIFSKYSGTEFKVDDDELLILGTNDILARFS